MQIRRLSEAPDTPGSLSLPAELLDNDILVAILLLSRGRNQFLGSAIDGGLLDGLPRSYADDELADTGVLALGEGSCAVCHDAGATEEGAWSAQPADEVPCDGRALWASFDLGDEVSCETVAAKAPDSGSVTSGKDISWIQGVRLWGWLTWLKRYRDPCKVALRAACEI